MSHASNNFSSIDAAGLESLATEAPGQDFGGLNSLPLALVLLDARGLVCDWNDAAEQMLGWSAAEAAGQIPPFVAADVDSPAGVLLSWLLAGQAIADQPATVRRENGETLAVRFSGAPLFDEYGNVLTIVVGIVSAAGERGAAPTESGPGSASAFLALDQRCVVATHSAEFCSLFGVPHELQTISGGSDDQLLSWMCGRLKKPAELDRLFKAVQANRRTTRGQLRLADDRELKCVGAPIVVRGEVCGQIWSISDATGNGRPIRAARRTDRVLRGVVDATNRLLARTNFELGMGEAIRALGQCMEADEVCIFENSLDASSKTMMSERFNWRAHNDEVRIDDPDLQGLSYDGLENWLTELSAGRSIQVWGYGVRDLQRCAPEQAKTASSLITPILLDGICWGFLGVRNMLGGRVWGGLEQSMLSALAGSISAALVRRRAASEMELAKEAAEAASQAKGLFLAHMSHEIRTPLNGIIGMTDLLLGANLTDQQGSFAKIAKSSANALLALVNDILDFSKIEAGKIELESLQFDLAACVEDAAEIMLPKAAEKCLEVACYVHPNVPNLVRGDSTRLRQILINLVNNAIKFTDKGEVVVRTTLEADLGERARIRFSVIDTGIGIPEDRREKLFKPFSQVETSTNRRFGGTGLGLAICRQLAELMGGQIGVESAVGAGSTFWFTAVLEKAAALETLVPCPIVAQPPDASARVLIVDDHPIQREILQAHLDSFGVSSSLAASADDALDCLCAAAAEGNPFRIALLDQTLAGMDGLALAKAINSDETFASTLLILVAPLDARFDDNQLKEHGVAALLTKPIRRSTLFDRLAEATGGRTSVRKTTRLRDDDTPTELATSAHIAATARILLAEDNHVNRLVVHEYLKRAGYTCEFAPDGEQAVRAVLAREFDLIFMDCQMPVMDGMEATRRIRVIEAERPVSPTQPARIPIVALTANAMKGDREQCLAVGMDAHICKPFDPKELIRVLESYLPASRRTLANAAAAASEAVAGAAVPTASTSTAAQRQAFDALLAGLGGDVGFVQQVIEVFKSQGASDVAKIEAAAAAADATAVAQAAHSLKGSAGHLAEQKLRELASTLEKAGRANDMQTIAVNLPRLQPMMKEVANRFEVFAAWASERSGR